MDRSILAEFSIPALPWFFFSFLEFESVYLMQVCLLSFIVH